MPGGSGRFTEQGQGDAGIYLDRPEANTYQSALRTSHTDRK